MKKQILNIGKALNKAEQKQIQGGITAFQACNQAVHYWCTQSWCESHGNIWYACEGSCILNVPHFPPC